MKGSFSEIFCLGLFRLRPHIHILSHPHSIFDSSDLSSHPLAWPGWQIFRFDGYRRLFQCRNSANRALGSSGGIRRKLFASCNKIARELPRARRQRNIYEFEAYQRLLHFSAVPNRLILVTLTSLQLLSQVLWCLPKCGTSLYGLY